MTVNALAKMIDHALLHPTLTDLDLKNGCALAVAYNVASVCIKPYAIKKACQWLEGSDVMVGTVVGFPHGSNSIEMKKEETEHCCIAGAVEIDLVVNIGKVLSEDWTYLEKEIREVYYVVKKYNAVIKVIFENDFLSSDQYKIKLCQICNSIGVDFIKTSTGFGMVKGGDGKYSYRGATEQDLILMRKHATGSVKVKASGGIRTVEEMLAVHALGATRIGTSSTKAILDAAAVKYSEEKINFMAGQLKGRY